MIRSSAVKFCKNNLKPVFNTLLMNKTHTLDMPKNDNPVETSIKEKLQSRLKPIHLDIINESYMHNVPKGSETHFKVVVVSEEFENMPLLGRHRLINSILESELKNGVHALSIVAKTASQWNPNEEVESSPKCLGGFGK